MNVLILTLTFACALIGACTSNKQQNRGNDNAVVPSLSTKLLFSVPDISKLKAGDKPASEIMTHYWFEVKEVPGSCKGGKAPHTPVSLSLINKIKAADPLSATVPVNCDYTVRLSLGVAEDSADDTELSLDLTVAKVSYNKDLKDIVAKKCLSCHDDDRPSANVNLTTVEGVALHKESIVNVINGGSPVMPPISSAKLSSAEKNAFIAWKNGGYTMTEEPSEKASDTSTDRTADSDETDDNSRSPATLEKIFYQNAEAITIPKETLQKYKTYSTAVELRLTKEGKKAGFTASILKSAQEKTVVNEGGHDQQDASVDENTDRQTKTETEISTETETNTDTNTGTSTNTAASVTYKDVQALIKNKCANCHPGQGQSDLSTYAKFKARGNISVDYIISERMPKNDRLTAEQIALFKKWREEGFPESASSAKDPKASDGTVEFRIPAGTGSKAWNSPNQPLQLKVGQKLKIINDDTTAHWLHTDGAPCRHGDNMPANGGTYTCELTSAYKGDLHDHLYSSTGFFYIQVTK